MNNLPQQFTVLAENSLVQKVYRFLPSIVVVILTLLLASIVAQVFWMFFAPEPELKLQPVQQRNNHQRQMHASATSSEYAAQISSMSLFGKAVKKEEVKVKPVDAPETRLDLKLRGIYANQNEEDGFALIASGSKEERLYKVGEHLPGNIKLSSVYPDRVMLERSGKFEVLKLPEVSPGRRISLAPKAGGIRSPHSGARTVNKTFTSNDSVGKLRKEILNNPAKITQFVNAVPARENGQFVGFKIVEKRSHPAFKELDIQSGDIVTQVNGINISSPEKGFQVLQKLRNAKQFNVTLNRGGQIVQLNHSIK